MFKYLSPSRNVPKEDLENLIKQLPSPFLILGDVIAEYPLWNKGHPLDQEGKILEKLLNLCSEDAPIHYHVQTGALSTADPPLISANAIAAFNWHIDSNLQSSGHYPIFLIANEYNPVQDITRWHFRKANWELFSDLTE